MESLRYPDGGMIKKLGKEVDISCFLIGQKREGMA